jgi:pimeloyl-ACP methyl ester carboxylesterase
MARLAFTRCGSGTPLLLLHGLGSSRQVWNPVLAALAEQFDVLAVDLPGFGDSPPLPAGIEPSPAALAAVLADLLDELGIRALHVAGNSLGGWVALELAGMRQLASLTLLSPAGLWRRHTPRYSRISVRASRWFARHATGLLCAVVRFRAGRILILAQSHGRPAHLTPDQARSAVRAMGSCPGFDATLRATLRRRYLAGPPIDAPVTLAFGTRDRILLKRQSRHTDQLPPNTQLAVIPGAGHLPMADNPAAVAALIMRSACRSAVARQRTRPDAYQRVIS